MIPAAAITAWSLGAPWPTRDQIEQDLVLSRLIVEIANHPYLGTELVFRGGTCFHKLHVQPARRYSEDLDYVRTTADGIGRVIDALREIGQGVGMSVSTRIGAYPKVHLRAPFESNPQLRMRVKVEVNTHERSPVDATTRQLFRVESAWFSGEARVQTFSLPELVTTKLRALYQRRKGRDLFDLWLALTELRVPAEEIVRCFPPYRPDGYTGQLAEANLREKVQRADFREDLLPLVGTWPSGYDVDTASELVISSLLRHL